MYPEFTSHPYLILKAKEDRRSPILEFSAHYIMQPFAFKYAIPIDCKGRI